MKRKLSVHKISGNIFFQLVWCVTFLFVSCNPSQPQKKQDTILPVKIFQVGSNAVVKGKNFPARTLPNREVEIAFRVSGPLVKLTVVEGEKVRKGQVIAQIDERDFKVKLEAAKADFELAKAELARYKRLFEKQSIAENEYDTKVAVYSTKEANYTDAQNALKDATIYAPFDGYIGEVYVENFEEVQAKQTIVTVLDLSDIEIQFYVPESMLFEADDIEGFEVYFEKYPEKKFRAVFEEVGKVADAEGFPVTLMLDPGIPRGKDKLDVIRAAGFTVRVNILYKTNLQEKTVLIPITAVMEPLAGQNSIVWVLDKNTMTVSKRKVSLQGFGPQSTIEIGEGLENGEWVITAGIYRLKEGQKVKSLPQKL